MGDRPIKGLILYAASINHNLTFGVERKYRVESNYKRSRLVVFEGEEFMLLAEIILDGRNVFTDKDGSGNGIGESIENIKTPATGFWKMTIENLDGYIDNVMYSHSQITQEL